MKYIVTVNDKNYEVEVEQGVAQVMSVAAAVPVVAAAPVAAAPVAQAPVAAAPAPAPTAAPAAAPAPAAVAEGDPLGAPMPGTILNVLKKVGDAVAEGDVVVLLEAMKMENEVVAQKSGKISQVLVSKGATVSTGDPLVMIV